MKQYIVKKLVMANSAKEAIDKSRRYPIAEVFADPSWKEPDKPIEGFKDKKKS
jgi:hypothetical protein